MKDDILIDLGTVSEETKGCPDGQFEGGSSNTLKEPDPCPEG